MRIDNGPEFLIHEFVDWTGSAGMAIQYIQPGKPNQNAYVELFNRTFRNDMLKLYLFIDIEEVSERTYRWMI